MSIRLALSAALIPILALSACSGNEDRSAIAWSDDPCGLAPPQAVAAAFGIDPVAIGDVPDGECRYRISDTVLRLSVLSDGNNCDAVIRSYAAMGITLTSPADAPDGVLVSEPQGDVVVCHEDATYVLIAPGRRGELLALAATSPSEPSD